MFLNFGFHLFALRDDLQFVGGALVSAAASMVAFFVLGFSFKILLVATIAGLVTPLFFFAADYTRYVVKTS